MDWYLDGSDGETVASLRHEIRGYLERHASADSRLDDAELVVSELLTNVFRHTQGPMWVSLRWANTEQPLLSVADLGPGFELDLSGSIPSPEVIGGRGLLLVNELAEQLEVASRRADGSVVSIELPVRRPVSPSIDPPRHRLGALPALDEARPEGGFDRGTFLRAMVVQMSAAIEEQQGPEAAEAMVAQVGTDIGGQMEAEYRAAEQITGRMTADQIAHCYVRLKHAIDGDFYVIEASPERIVLGNHRCPFGEAVQRSPALCRMTSSVFGGLGARNSDDGVTVLLEERIALGDPGCRVVVEFDPDADPTGSGHRYLPPVA